FKSQLLLEQNSQRVLEGLKKVNALLPNAQVWLTVPGHMEEWAKEQFSGYTEILPLAQNYRARIHREVIAKITGKRVSIRDSYIKHGIAVQDVEYLLAMLDALDGSSPFLQKYLTISGSGLEKAITVRFPLGSSLKHVLTSQGLEVSDYTRPVVGGPMKGIAQYSELTPLTHNDGIYLIKEDVAPSDLIAPCINCGRCARICPAKIQVHLVNRMIEFGQTESAKSLHSEACHECGLCGHVCPAERPIVQLIRFCNSDMVLGARHTWEAGGQK
ncbi:MAG: 4Fe-4S dicluster domain-containing protein, partial [Desulfobulbaceae bacterium]